MINKLNYLKHKTYLGYYNIKILYWKHIVLSLKLKGILFE